MKALLRLTALLLLGMVGLLSVSGCGKPHVLTFRAVVDGSDVVKVSGGQLGIEHGDFQLPSQIFVNGKAWHPVWNGKVSEPLQDLIPAFHPRDPQKVKIAQLKGRGTTSILQMPGITNEQTLAFRIDDNAQGGADTYQITVSW